MEDYALAGRIAAFLQESRLPAPVVWPAERTEASLGKCAEYASV